MNTPPSIVIKSALLFGILALTGCATLYNQTDKIPGLDRIINYFSKAEVGPVKKTNGEVIQGTETAELSPENQDITATTSQTASATNNALTSSLKTAVESNERQNAESSVAAANDSALLSQTASKQKVATNASIKAPHHVISGNVRLLGKQGEISPEGVMVRLHRLDGTPLQKTAPPASHEIDMIDKTYTPSNAVIRTGDSINFVNSDFIQHNVFSSSGENAFDLGTFGGGLQREVKLNKEGVVKVYCNIHPGMATFVAVDDAGVSQVVNAKDGFFEFSSLPIGEYQLTLWSVRGEQTQQVTLAATQKLHLDLTFDTSSYESPEHANKFGENYQKKSIRREFY